MDYIFSLCKWIAFIKERHGICPGYLVALDSLEHRLTVHPDGDHFDRNIRSRIAWFIHDLT